jgi:hypothetical protein
MHTVSTVRKGGVLGALVAPALLAAVLFVATPKASASISQCEPGGKVCAWSGGSATGNFSWWAANTGCHNHAGNPNIRSMYNRTDHDIELPGRGFLGAGFSFGWAEPAITGLICT